MLNISGIISKFVKNSSQRELDKLKLIVEKINSWESKIKDAPNESFPLKTAEFKSNHYLLHFSYVSQSKKASISEPKII